MPAFAEEWQGTECWVCGLPLRSHGESFYDQRGTIDHMAGRNSNYCHHRTNLLWAAWMCHRLIIPGMSMEDKVNLKIKYDPGGFDETIFLPIRKAKDGRIDF